MWMKHDNAFALSARIAKTFLDHKFPGKIAIKSPDLNKLFFFLEGVYKESNVHYTAKDTRNRISDAIQNTTPQILNKNEQISKATSVVYSREL